MDPIEYCTKDADQFIASAAAHANSLLLAMDFDGTLSEMVPNPDEARMHLQAAAALERLGSAVGQLAIITGRSVATVKQLGSLEQRPGFERVIVLGQYGVERWDAASGQSREPEAPAAVAQAVAELKELLARLGDPGIRMEDKVRGVAVHTRQAAHPQESLARVEPAVRELAERLDLVFEPGKFVVELRGSTASKGDALHELVTECQPTHVAMLGDDLGDLPAFEKLTVLRSEGITCCAVVSSSTEQPALAEVADVMCDGPAGVAAWLQKLADELECSS